MSDDKQQSGGQDRTRINVHEDCELHDWARKFDATPQQIRDAVQAVGDRAADVEMHLKGTHSTTNADAQAAADGSSRP